MPRKFKGYKGHGNGYKNSRVFKPDKKLDSFMSRVRDAIELDRWKAENNNMVLVVDTDIQESNKSFIQACIFCPSGFIKGHLTPISMVKVKENHFKCPLCNFVKIKRGVEIGE